MLALASSRTLALSNIVELLRSVDRLLNLEVRHGKAIEKIERDIESLKERVTQLEVRNEVTIEKAKAAAGAAATQVAIASVSDISRRIGVLEAMSGQWRLNAPE